MNRITREREEGMGRGVGETIIKAMRSGEKRKNWKIEQKFYMKGKRGTYWGRVESRKSKWGKRDGEVEREDTVEEVMGNEKRREYGIQGMVREKRGGGGTVKESSRCW